MSNALAGRAVVEVRPCASQIGSGSLPVDRLPSAALVITPSTKGRGAGTALKGIEKALRDLPIPVIGRVHGGALWLDLRCLEDEAAFEAQVTAMAKP
jgi:L-seryl-tRNA(Ser) seleniumtransferase